MELQYSIFCNFRCKLKLGEQKSMKRIIYLFFMLLVFISCDNNPCEYPYKQGSKPPHILSVQFSPKKAKIGDTINMIIIKEKSKSFKNLDYDKDFEITDDGKIKYVGKGTFYDFYDESGIVGTITDIISERNNTAPHIDVTEYISIQGFYYDLVDVIAIDFKVPVNAKSGYIRTTDPMCFAYGGFSEEKLIIVDENGNEITE